MSQRETRLRQLARDYAEGRIDRAVYLRARTQFLDSVSLRAAGEDATATTVPAWIPKTAQPETPGAPRPRAPRGLLPVALLGIGALVAVAVATRFFGDGGERPNSPDTPTPPPQATLAPAASDRPGAPVVEPAGRVGKPDATALIEQLLEERSWGPSEREEFAAQWREQDPDAQAAARGSQAFLRLGEELRLLLDALYEAGDGGAEVDGLRRFGAGLGLDVGEVAVKPGGEPQPERQPEPSRVERTSGPTHAQVKMAGAVAQARPGPREPNDANATRPNQGHGDTGEVVRGPEAEGRPGQTAKPASASGHASETRPEPKQLPRVEVAPARQEPRPGDAGVRGAIQAAEPGSEPDRKPGAAPVSALEQRPEQQRPPGKTPGQPPEQDELKRLGPEPEAVSSAATASPSGPGPLPAAPEAPLGPGPAATTARAVEPGPGDGAEPPARGAPRLVPEPTPVAAQPPPTQPAQPTVVAAPTAPPLPTLAQRLTRRTPSDPCASAARGARGATYTCKDHKSAPELFMIPADVPFAIAKPFTAKTIEQAYSRSRAAASGEALDDLGKVDLMAASISKYTKRRYRLATEAELIEAARYGPAFEGIPLVREIDLPEDAGEAEALERWWQQYQRPGR